MSTEESMPKRPEGWVVVRVSECVVKTELVDPRASPGRQFRYVDVSSVSAESLRIVEWKTYLGADAPSRARRGISAGDVLFATVRPGLRRLAQVPEDLAGEVCSTAFTVLRANPELIDPDFLFLAVSAPEFVDRVARQQRGTGYPAVRNSDVLGETVLLPPLPEQRAIGQVLLTLDRARQGTSQVVLAARELKRSVREYLFANGFIPPATLPFDVQETALGPVPDGWKVMRLGDLLREALRNGKSAPATNSEHGVRTLILTAVTTGDFSTRNTKLTSADASNIADLWLAPGDILVERANTRELVGTAALYEGAPGFAIFPDLVIRVRVDETRVLPKFVAEYLLTHRVQAHFSASATGTAGNMPKISQDLLADVPVPFPSLVEQEVVVRGLRACDRKVEAETQKHGALDELFASAQHGLLSGGTRVAELAEVMT